MTQQMIDVLWIDDNKDIWNSYSNLAGDEEYQLLLHPFDCWEDAETELLNHFEQYEAIILDAKCKYRRNDDAKATKFLSHAIADIRGICTQKQHQIHWYVLSAGDANVGDIDDLIHEERRIWDGDWETESEGRPYYRKISDEICRLFTRIKEQISYSPRTQLKAFLYKDVFDAVGKIHMNPESAELLVDLLFPINYPQLDASSEKHLVYAIRKCLEYLFRALIEEWCILPPSLIQNGEVILAGSSRILSGLEFQKVKVSNPIVDRIIGNNIWNMLQATNGSIHTEKQEIEINNKDIITHKLATNDSHYLLRSYTMQLCDILIYMEGIVRKYPDKEKNREKWDAIQES